MSRLEVPEGTHIHVADAAAHSLGASNVWSVFDNEYDGDYLVSQKLVAVETDNDIKQADFDAALKKQKTPQVADTKKSLIGTDRVAALEQAVQQLQDDLKALAAKVK
jgi:hypothetical protein